MGRRSLWMCVDPSLSHGSMLVTFVTTFRCERRGRDGVNDGGGRLPGVQRCCSQSKVNMTRFHAQCQGSKGEGTM